MELKQGVLIFARLYYKSPVIQYIVYLCSDLHIISASGEPHANAYFAHYIQ